MKNYILIFICLISSAGFSQEANSFKCGWYGKKTVAERNQMFPFNKTKKIVLISYKNCEMMSLLADSLTLEEAKAIKPDIKKKYVISPDGSTQARIYFVIEEKELDEGWKNELSHILCNYTLSSKPKEGYLVGITDCYTPRNSILFLDENDAVISFMEICFECRRYFLSPDPEDINEYADVYECSERLDEIKRVFKKNRIVYGVSE